MGVAITQPPEAILSFPVGARAHSARPQDGEPGYGLEALEGSRRGRNFQGPRAPGASRLPGTAAWAREPGPAFLPATARGVVTA